MGYKGDSVMNSGYYFYAPSRRILEELGYESKCSENEEIVSKFKSKDIDLIDLE